jgi:hypothetical protein
MGLVPLRATRAQYHAVLSEYAALPSAIDTHPTSNFSQEAYTRVGYKPGTATVR